MAKKTKVFELVLEMDNDWLNEFYNWIADKDEHMPAGSVCWVKNIDQIPARFL